MQKLFAIVFSFLVLFQSLNMSLEDVSKMDVLLEHAEYHQDTYGDSFFEFLVEHYSAVEDNSDHREHENLPFKHQTCGHTSVAFTFETITFDFTYDPFIEIPFNFFYKESVSLFEKSSVFQPPRVV